EGERFHVRPRLWHDIELQEILILDAGVLRVERRMRAVQDHLPRFLTRLRPQRVSAGRDELSVQLYLARERDCRALVRAGAPDTVVGDERPEQVPPARDRAVVFDRDRRVGDLLRDRSVLTWLDR